MSDREQELRRDIMRRVRFIHGVRFFVNFFLSGEVLKGMVFGASVFFVVSMTHISNVLSNMALLESWVAYPNYLYGAYMHASLTVEAIVLLALAVGGWLMFDMGRNVRYWIPGLRRV